MTSFLTTFLIIIAYFFASRIFISLLLNMFGPSIDDRHDGWMHFVMWIPIVGEFGFLFFFCLITCGICIIQVDNRTKQLTEAIKSRFPSLK